MSVYSAKMSSADVSKKSRLTKLALSRMIGDSDPINVALMFNNKILHIHENTF